MSLECPFTFAESLSPLAFFAGRKPPKKIESVEGPKRPTADTNSRRAGDRDHRSTDLDRPLHNAKTRVVDAGRSRIGNDCDDSPRTTCRRSSLGTLHLVVFVITDEAVRDAIVIEQLERRAACASHAMTSTTRNVSEGGGWMSAGCRSEWRFCEMGRRSGVGTRSSNFSLYHAVAGRNKLRKLELRTKKAASRCGRGPRLNRKLVQVRRATQSASRCVRC